MKSYFLNCVSLRHHVPFDVCSSPGKGPHAAFYWRLYVFKFRFICSVNVFYVLDVRRNANATVRACGAAACWMWNRNQQRQANDRRRKERGEGWEIRGRGREEKQGRKGNTEDINDTEQGCDERKKGVREINEVTERLVVTKAKRKTTLQWMRNTFFNKKRWSLSVQRNKLLPENLIKKRNASE